MADNNSEYRQITMHGELPPEQWDSLLTYMGEQGLYPIPRALGIYDPALDTYEELREDEVTVDHKDMLAFALENGYTNTDAGRVWNLMRSVYDHKVYSPHYRQSVWFDEETAITPVRFAGPKPIATDSQGHSIWYDNLHGLSLESVVELLTQVDQVIEQTGDEREAIRSSLGRGTGPAVYTFLKQFVASRQVREVEG